MKNFNIFINFTLIFALLLVGVFLYNIFNIVLLFFAAFVIASAINPLVDRLSLKMERKTALLILAVSGLVLISLVLIPLANVIMQQFVLFLTHAPQYWNQVEVLINQFLNNENILFVNELLQKSNILPNISQIMASMSGVGQNILQNSINLTKGLFTAVMFSFTLVLITVYMLIDKEGLRKGFLSLFPKKIQPEVSSMTTIISRKVGGYVVGQLIMMFWMGFFISVGLSIIKIEFSLILGTIAGLLDIIPVVGPAIAVTSIVLVALAQKPILALWAFGVYMLTQWVTDTFIRPVIFGKFLDLHPLVLIFSLLSGAILLGVVGVILAPAIAATISAMIEELYIKRINPEALKPKKEPLKFSFPKFKFSLKK